MSEAASAEIIDLDATRLAAGIAARTFSVEEVAKAYLARIAERNAAVQAWAWLDADGVLEAARALDASPVRGPLHGVPLGTKDVFQTRDMPTEYGSPLYAGHQPALDAASVETLRTAGALVFGKTTTVEFAAMGHKPSTRHPAFPDRSPGGTSSGSAAAVADRQVPLALGTQTSGSTIRPASFCGVHAFKPTWNLVSREGVKLFSISLDTVSWFGRSCDDLALVFEQFAIFAMPVPPAKSLAELRIGVCRTPFWSSAAETVREAFDGAVRQLEAQGARCEVLELPPLFEGLKQAGFDIALGEGRAALLNEHRARGGALHSQLTDAFFAGDPFPAERLRAAADLADEGRKAFDTLAAGYDAVLVPSAADVAPLGLESTGDPVFNQMWTLLQTPCLNLPLPREGLPIGITLTGPRYTDRRILAAAGVVERALHGG